MSIKVKLQLPGHDPCSLSLWPHIYHDQPTWCSRFPLEIGNLFRSLFPNWIRLPDSDLSVLMMTNVPARKTVLPADVSTFAKKVFAVSTFFANPIAVAPSTGALPAITVIHSLVAVSSKAPVNDSNL